MTDTMSKHNSPRLNEETQQFLSHLESECRRARATLTTRRLSKEEEGLRKRILKAFKGVTCQQERAWLECEAWDDYLTDPQLLGTLRAREERRNWAALPPELLLACDCAPYHAGPEAFRFLLPAYMLLSLDYESPWINDMLFAPFGVSKQKRASGGEWMQEKYSLLNNAQRSTVEQWMNYLQQQNNWMNGNTLPWLGNG